MEIIKASEIKQHYDTYIDLAAYYAMIDDIELSTINLNKAEVLAKIIGIDFDTVVEDLQARTKAKINNNKHYQKLLTKISTVIKLKNHALANSKIEKTLEEIEQDYRAILIDTGRDIGYTPDQVNEDILKKLSKDR